VWCCSKLRIRDAQFSSKAYGTREYKEISIDGRIQFDLLVRSRAFASARAGMQEQQASLPEAAALAPRWRCSATTS
jgi:hypothetical protein